MHLAVEHNAILILAFMIIELKLNPNSLTAKKDDIFCKDGPSTSNHHEMSVFHIAISLQKMEIIDLLMQHSTCLNINLVSPEVGTPLQVACRAGNIKIVQKLVLSGADISIEDPKTGKSARE